MSGNEKKRIKIVPIISNSSESKNIKLEDKQENPTVQDQSDNNAVKAKEKRMNFQCTICERFFHSSVAVIQHLMRVHNIAGKTDLPYRHLLDRFGELKRNDIRFNVPKNLKTYTRKPVIKQDIKEEPEFIVPD